MRIGSILENQEIEKRIAITPEVVKKYKSLGLEVLLSKNYGLNLGIQDKEYEQLGVKIFNETRNSKDAAFMYQSWSYGAVYFDFFRNRFCTKEVPLCIPTRSCSCLFLSSVF